MTARFWSKWRYWQQEVCYLRNISRVPATVLDDLQLYRLM